MLLSVAAARGSRSLILLTAVQPAVQRTEQLTPTFGPRTNHDVE